MEVRMEWKYEWKYEWRNGNTRWGIEEWELRNTGMNPVWQTPVWTSTRFDQLDLMFKLGARPQFEQDLTETGSRDTPVWTSTIELNINKIWPTDLMFNLGSDLTTVSTIIRHTLYLRKNSTCIFIAHLQLHCLVAALFDLSQQSSSVFHVCIPWKKVKR